MFITFEGINGSGKTTQAKKLFEHLTAIGKNVVLTKEPGGGGEFCMALRELLLKTKDISSMTELFVLYASRTEHLRKVVEPALNDGKIVICDRYIDSSFAYQCFEKPERKHLVEFLHKTINGLMPDITFLIDIPVEVSEARLAPLVYEAMISGQGYKKYDELETSHMQKIINEYHNISNEYKDRVKLIDGTKSIDEIHNDIVEKITSILN
jgi:dTMP kinase